MGIQGIGMFVRWSARLLGLVVGGMTALFLVGEGFGPRGTHTLNPLVLSAREAALLALLIVAASALLLAWRWERYAGLTAAVLGSAFLLYCAFTPGMYRAWILGVSLAVPGWLFAIAAELRT
jgi:hypothetical protein